MVRFVLIARQYAAALPTLMPGITRLQTVLFAEISRFLIYGTAFALYIPGWV